MMEADVDSYLNNTAKMWFPLTINLIMSIFTYFLTVRIIPGLKEKFIKANLFGIDMSKRTSDKV